MNILTPPLLRTEEDLGCEELSLCTELSEDQALLEDQGEEEHDLGELHLVSRGGWDISAVLLSTSSWGGGIIFMFVEIYWLYLLYSIEK